MNRERELFERAVSEAYERQTKADSTPASETRRRVVSRGRHRRLAHVLGSAALVAVVAAGSAASVNAMRHDQDRLRVVDDSPAIGSEKIMDFGGPMAGSNGALFVANDYLNNDAGDKASIARFDLTTGEVTNTDPTSASFPQNISLGTSGLWLVQWSGDLPIGDGNRARGTIQLVNPVSGEVLLDLPREDSAPFDVAAGESDGREVAWVVDGGLDQLLEVDAASGEIQTIDLESSPSNVTVGAGAVWVSSNERGDGGALIRFDLVSGALQSFPVDHCMNDLVVLDESVWVTDYCGEAVHRFDAASGEELAAVPVGGSPSAITTADGLIWVMRDSDVLRVDPTSAEVVGDPIVVGEGSFFDSHIIALDDTVFVSTFDGVYRLGEGLPVREPQPTPTPTPEEPHRPLASETCNLDNVMCIPLDRPWSIAGAGFGSGWVGNVGEGKTFGIARFDAETGEETARLNTVGFVQQFAPDERWMWALLDASDYVKLLKIDPETTSVSASYDLGSAGNIAEPSLAVGAGYVWVSQPRGAVTRVDAATGQMTTMSYAPDLPGYGEDNGPLHLAYGDDQLWLSYGRGHLGVVDPSSGELIRLDKDVLGENAYDIIVAEEAVWSSHQSPNGDNEITYSPTSGPDGELNRVLLLDAIPGLAATDGDRIWVVQDGFDENDPGWLVEVDARTHQLVGEPLELSTEFEGGVAVGDGYVWVTGNEVLYRVTPGG